MIAEILKLIAEKGPMLCVAYSRIMRHGAEPSNNSYDSTKENRIIMNDDFAPFELAVKLQEKGFDKPCTYAYCEQGGWNKYRQVHEPITHILRTDGNPFGSFYRGKNWNVKYETNKNKIRCSAPSISQVLKWLREEKKIHIIVEISDSGWYYTLYPNVRWENGILKSDKYIMSFKHKASYEQAALAGIEYVLDNLI